MTRKNGHDSGSKAQDQSSQMTHDKDSKTTGSLKQPEIVQYASEKSRSMATGLMHRLVNWLSKVDRKAVKERVNALRGEMPQAEDQVLIEQLIKRKCEHTARIGAATAATGSIPVLGTMVSMTVGMLVDLGAVITAQAELVLEIAEVLGVEMSDADRRETVFVVLGLGAGIEHLTSIASQRVLRGLGERFAQRWLAHALPLLGIAAAAGINAISTYVIGKRAVAYFTRGEAAMGDWRDNLRAISGLDERKLADWLKDLGQEFGNGLPHLQQGFQQNLKQLQKGQGLKILQDIQDSKFAQQFRKLPIVDEISQRGQQAGHNALDFGQQMIERARHLIDPSLGLRPHSGQNTVDDGEDGDQIEKQAEDQAKTEAKGQADNQSENKAETNADTKVESKGATQAEASVEAQAEPEKQQKAQTKSEEA